MTTEYKEKYKVSIGNEESSVLANVVSITGQVNQIQVAAKVQLSALSGLNPQEQKKLKQRALVEAYLNKSQDVLENDTSDEVTL